MKMTKDETLDMIIEVHDGESEMLRAKGLSPAFTKLYRDLDFGNNGSADLLAIGV